MESAHTVVKMVSSRARNGFSPVSWMPTASELEVDGGQIDLLDHMNRPSPHPDSEGFRSAPRTCPRFHGSLSVR
jgi:hypothetical protein